MKGGIMAALQGCTHVISCTSTPCHMNETALLIKIIISLTKKPPQFFKSQNSQNSSKIKTVLQKSCKCYSAN